MMRSSSHSLDSVNIGKREEISRLVQEYRRFCQVLVDDIWENGIPEWGFFPKKNRLEGLQSFIPIEYPETWMSARLKQAVPVIQERSHDIVSC